MKVLLIGDTADNNYTLKKFSKDIEFHLINFPRKEDGLITTSNEGTEFFESLLLSKQVKKIKSIKNNFDICLVIGWAAARVAYFSGINYIMYFVGNDIVTPPFLKNPTEDYSNEPVSTHNLFERSLYRKIFDAAVACITVNSHYYSYLKKFRNDAIRMDRIFVDTEIFNYNIKPIELEKNEFTFFSPQRIGMEKGYDVIFKALKLCKTNFKILQVKWFIDRTNEEKEFNKKIIEELPSQIKLIPLIPRKDLGRYYTFADAILGQLRVGTQGAIERDSAMCKKPVICYNDPQKKMILDGVEIIPPFLPKSKDPEELARLIDKIVLSKEFRDDLAEKEFEYVMKLSEPSKVIQDWKKIFTKIVTDYPTIERKNSKILLRFENLIANFLEKAVYTKKFREKNIQAWGKAEYDKLTK